MKLSKPMIIIVIFLLNAFMLNAMANKGIKIGLGLQTLINQKDVDAKISTNISLGFFLTHKITNRLSFQPELNLALKTIDFNGEVKQYIDNDGDGQIDEDPFDLLDNDGDGQIDEDGVDFFCQGNGQLQSTSIEIPLLLKYLLKNSDSNSFSLLLGPSFNFFLQHSFELYTEHKQKGSIKNDRFDLGGSLGLEFTHKNLVFGLNFSESILKNKWELKSDDYSESDDYDMGFFDTIESRNLSLSFLVGFSF